MTNTILILNPCGCKQVCSFAEGGEWERDCGGKPRSFPRIKKKKSALCERIAHNLVNIYKPIGRKE